MSLYKPHSVADEPAAILQDWRVYEADLPGLAGATRHFTGYNTVTSDGRVSSPIEEFDHELKRGLTRSGRLYQLDGASGHSSEGDYVWRVWCRANGIHPDQARDVTSDYV